MSLTTSAVTMMLPVHDVDRARTFYSECLGLECTGTNDEGGATYSLDGSATLELLPRPDSRPTGSTAMSFEVDDVSAEITQLEGRGVTFEDYDLPGLTTSTMSPRWGTTRPPGSRTRTATSSACTRNRAELTAASVRRSTPRSGRRARCGGRPP